MTDASTASTDNSLVFYHPRPAESGTSISIDSMGSSEMDEEIISPSAQTFKEESSSTADSKATASADTETKTATKAEESIITTEKSSQATTTPGNFGYSRMYTFEQGPGDEKPSERFYETLHADGKTHNWVGKFVDGKMIVEDADTAAAESTRAEMLSDIADRWEEMRTGKTSAPKSLIEPFVAMTLPSMFGGSIFGHSLFARPMLMASPFDTWKRHNDLLSTMFTPSFFAPIRSTMRGAVASDTSTAAPSAN